MRLSLLRGRRVLFPFFLFQKPFKERKLWGRGKFSFLGDFFLETLDKRAYAWYNIYNKSLSDTVISARWQFYFKSKRKNLKNGGFASGLWGKLCGLANGQGFFVW